MSRTITFALAVVLALTTWLSAERSYHHSVALYLVTSFDFSAYSACRSGKASNCVQAFRFYEADSRQLLSEVPAKANMTGRQQIIGKATVGSIPHGIYAVTVYLDSDGKVREGRPGDVSEFRNAGY